MCVRCHEPGIAHSFDDLSAGRGLAAIPFVRHATVRRGERFAMQNSVARFARELGNDQVIGGAKQGRHFRGGKGVAGFEGDPLGAREIRSGNDAGTLREFREVFRRHFEGEPHASGFQRRDGEHSAGNLEEKVVTPLDLLGGRWKGETELAELIDVHRRNPPGQTGAAWRTSGGENPAENWEAIV